MICGILGIRSEYLQYNDHVAIRKLLSQLQDNSVNVVELIKQETDSPDIVINIREGDYFQDFLSIIHSKENVSLKIVKNPYYSNDSIYVLMNDGTELLLKMLDEENFLIVTNEEYHKFQHNYALHLPELYSEVILPVLTYHNPLT